jgi:hypothetical protein
VKPWRALCLSVTLGVTLVGASGCKSRTQAPSTQYFVAEPLKLAIPKLPGWLRDPTVKVDPKAPRGTLLRLVRESAVAGSPRIEVVLEQPRDRPSILDEFLTHNLREMAQLEASGQMRIINVDQKQVHIGGVPAWRVHHEYTLGSGSAQVSINQVSTFLVLDGHGVAVTAIGRTELFHPLAEMVESMLDGLTTDASQPGAKSPPRLKGVPEGLQPVDLGHVGGKRPK